MTRCCTQTPHVAALMHASSQPLAWPDIFTCTALASATAQHAQHAAVSHPLADQPRRLPLPTAPHDPPRPQRVLIHGRHCQARAHGHHDEAAQDGLRGRDNSGSYVVGTPPSWGPTSTMDSCRRDREGMEQPTNIQLCTLPQARSVIAVGCLVSAKAGEEQRDN